MRRTKRTGTASKIKALVKKCLNKPDPFLAVESIVSSQYFPKPWNDDEFEKLPAIIKTVNRVRSFMVHSGANGLFGLFTDYPVNIEIAETERALEAISAVSSLRFLEKLKSVLPGRRYPRTVEEALAVEEMVTNAAGENSLDTDGMRKCIRAYAEETVDLPEQLRQYLVLNEQELIHALLHCGTKPPD